MTSSEAGSIAIHQITHDRFYAVTTRNILDFALREMQQPSGGFASAEDADSQMAIGKPETSEGAFYVWSEKQIVTVVGTPDDEVFRYAYGIESGGNIPAHQDVRGELKGKNVLYEAHTTEETAKKPPGRGTDRRDTDCRTEEVVVGARPPPSSPSMCLSISSRFTPGLTP